LRRHCSDLTPRIIPVAVPEGLASDARKNWWTSRASFMLIVKEYAKYIFYKMISPRLYRTFVNLS
jgi:hypothetical protein